MAWAIFTREEQVAARSAEISSLADAPLNSSGRVRAVEPVAKQTALANAFSTKTPAPKECGTELWNMETLNRALQGSCYVVAIDRLHFHRFPPRVEKNVVIAEWKALPATDLLLVNNSSVIAIQFPGWIDVHIDTAPGRLATIGGIFGIKDPSYPQMAVCALASKKAGGRPVKWVETPPRPVSSAQGNERTFRNTRRSHR